MTVDLMGKDVGESPSGVPTLAITHKVCAGFVLLKTGVGWVSPLHFMGSVTKLIHCPSFMICDEWGDYAAI